MRIENGCVLCSDGFRNALLHFQNLHARLNKRGLEPSDLVRNLGRRDPVPRDVIQVIAHDMDLAAGHSGRNACSFKPDFLTMTTRNPHKHGRWPRVKPKPIRNRNVFFDLLGSCGAAGFSIQQTHYTAPFPATPEPCEGGRSIKLSSLALKSTALFWPRPLNFSSIAATSIRRAIS